MLRITKLSRTQIAEFAKDPQQIKFFEALQSNNQDLPDALAVLTAAVAEAQFDADIGIASANEALTLANQTAASIDHPLTEMVMQQPGGGDVVSAATAGAATKTTPVDADLIPLADSAAGFTLKNLTWANLKATLKTYFDSVVTTLTNKTIALGSNTISGTLAQFNTAVTDADLASLAGIETLTNKTINLASNTLVATSAQLAAALTDETGTGSAVFGTNPTLTTPKATTTIGVGNATPSASGSGISFPATQSASTDANTLDDYEEGTFTPALNGSFTHSLQSGSYTKIGRLVSIFITVSWTANASASTGLRITNFPFACGSLRAGSSLGYIAGLDTQGNRQVVLTISSGNTYADFFVINDNTVAAAIDANLCSATGEVQAAMTYEV